MCPRMDAPLPLAGRYRFLRRLRGTSSGVIWLASDSVAGRTVVASSITSTRVPGLRRSVNLEHPHLASMLDLFDNVSPAQIPGRVALRPGMAIAVAEHVTGQTLHEKLEAGALPPERAVAVIANLATGLHALHARGGIHGALSPRSIVIARNDGGPVPVLTNLRAAANGAYCSPDRVRGGGPSAEDDTWALHATLFAALTGDSPYHGRTREELAGAILSGSVPDLSRFGIDDGELRRLVQEGLQPKPNRRQTQVAGLARSLASWLQAHPHAGLDRPSAVPPVPTTIAPPPIDDEDVAEGHRTVALAAPVQNARLPEDEEKDDDEMETVQLDASSVLARAMALHGSPLGDADDPSLGDQVPTTVMSAGLLDEMVDQVKAAASQRRPPMQSETRSMEVMVGDFPETKGDVPSEPGLATTGLLEADSEPPPSDGSDPPPVEVAQQPTGLANDWGQPSQPVVDVNPAPVGLQNLGAPLSPTTDQAGPQKGWGPAEPTPPHLDPNIVWGHAAHEPGSQGFVDPSVAQPAAQPAPPKKKLSIVWLILAGMVLMAVAAAISFVVAVVAANGHLPGPLGSLIPRNQPPPIATPSTSAGVAPVESVNELDAAVPEPIESAAPAASSAASSAAPAALSPEDLQRCVQSYFPSDTFIREVPFEYICKNDNPRKAAVMLHQQLVVGGGGAVTTGMRIWSSLSWYELAVIAILRDGCCPDASPIALPEPGDPCKPMNDVLAEVARGGCSEEAATQRAVAFEEAVNCMYKNDLPKPYRYRGVVRVQQRAAFIEFLKGIPADRCPR